MPETAVNRAIHEEGEAPYDRHSLGSASAEVCSDKQGERAATIRMRGVVAASV